MGDMKHLAKRDALDNDRAAENFYMLQKKMRKFKGKSFAGGAPRQVDPSWLPGFGKRSLIF